MKQLIQVAYMEVLTDRNDSKINIIQYEVIHSSSTKHRNYNTINMYIQGIGEQQNLIFNTVFRRFQRTYRRRIPPYLNPNRPASHRSHPPPH